MNGVNFSLRDRRKNHPLLAGIGNVVALTSPLQPRLPILWASEIASTCSLWFADSFILSWRILLRRIKSVWNGLEEHYIVATGPKTSPQVTSKLVRLG